MMEGKGEEHATSRATEPEHPARGMSYDVCNGNVVKRTCNPARSCAQTTEGRKRACGKKHMMFLLCTGYYGMGL